LSMVIGIGTSPFDVLIDAIMPVLDAASCQKRHG
jgi:hypothetical protein